MIEVIEDHPPRKWYQKSRFSSFSPHWLFRCRSLQQHFYFWKERTLALILKIYVNIFLTSSIIPE